MSRLIHSLEVGYPPSVNAMYSGKRFLTDVARAYKAEVGWMYSDLSPSFARLRVDLRLYRPRKRGDIDNVLKMCFDSLNGFAWGDDEQIVELHMLRFDDKDNPRIELDIYELEPTNG